MIEIFVANNLQSEMDFFSACSLTENKKFRIHVFNTFFEQIFEDSEDKLPVINIPFHYLYCNTGHREKDLFISVSYL